MFDLQLLLYLSQATTSSSASSNGSAPLVVTAELAAKLKNELAAQQVIHVPTGTLAGVDWAAKLKVCNNTLEEENWYILTRKSKLLLKYLWKLERKIPTFYLSLLIVNKKHCFPNQEGSFRGILSHVKVRTGFFFLYHYIRLSVPCFSLFSNILTILSKHSRLP